MEENEYESYIDRPQVSSQGLREFIEAFDKFTMEIETIQGNKKQAVNTAMENVHDMIVRQEKASYNELYQYAENMRLQNEKLNDKIRSLLIQIDFLKKENDGFVKMFGLK